MSTRSWTRDPGQTPSGGRLARSKGSRRYVSADLLAMGVLVRVTRKSSQVRRPTAWSGARFAPARNARAALPGSRMGRIGRLMPRACR